MKRLGIIQPEKIGDIIICLPIAKWYHDRGWDVYWPVSKNLINNFVGYVDYVTFIPIESDCRYAHQQLFALQCNRIIDLAFTIPGANAFNSDWYLNKNDSLTFDEMKYAIAEVPFEEKWNLQITRNYEKEKLLFDRVCSGSKYTLIQEQSSDTYIKCPIQPKYTKVDLKVYSGFYVFDWLKIIENASSHILIASSFLNMVDQMNKASIENDQYVIMKPGYDGKMLKDGNLQGFPRLKLNWNKI